LKETGTIGRGGGSDSTCGGVLLLVRKDRVGAACDGVGGRGGRKWAAAKALSVDSRGLVLLIPFMVSMTSYENFGCSFGNHFSSVNLWLRDNTPPLNPPHSAGPKATSDQHDFRG
jgi:hypothetical protein